MSPAEVETMMYAGETPWHRLGTKVEGLQTAQEAIAAAGLDWTVELTPVFIKVGENYLPIEDKQAIFRTTDGRVYNVVGSRYTPIQNEAAFAFFDNVVGEGKAIYETAGALMGGAQTWILANLKDSIGIAGEEIKKYLLLFNSHDGSGALQMFWTPIRVVCWNTLQASFSGAATRFYSRHTAGAPQRIEAAQELLGLANRFYADWKEQADRLAQIQLPPAKMPKLLMAAFGTTGAQKMDEVPAVTRGKMERAEELIHVGRGQGNPKIQGTAWQAFNGIAEYADHELSYRGADQDDARLRGLLWGSGANVKARAWSYLLKVK